MPKLPTAELRIAENSLCGPERIHNVQSGSAKTRKKTADKAHHSREDERRNHNAARHRKTEGNLREGTEIGRGNREELKAWLSAHKSHTCTQERNEERFDEECAEHTAALKSKRA